MKGLLLNTWLQAFTVLAITSGALTVQSLPELKKDISAWRGTTLAKTDSAITPRSTRIQAPTTPIPTPQPVASTTVPADVSQPKHQTSAEPPTKVRRAAVEPPAAGPVTPTSRGGVAEFQLAMSYYEGVGVAKDFTRAAQLFQQSASAGNASSMAKLGWMYWFGEGVDPDAKKGAEWFTRGAKAENPEAQYWLATFYEKGYGGLKKDDRQAVAMLRRSAAHGYSKAIEALKARGEQLP